MPLIIDDTDLRIASLFYAYRTKRDLPTFAELKRQIMAMDEPENVAADLAAHLLSGLKQDKEKIK